MNQWRYYAGAGLFAAVVSLISGIAGGNPFGVILLRMLFSAIILAGVGMGAGTLLRKFLPELLQSSAGGESAPAQPAVDIVIPEENPHEWPAVGDEEEAASVEPLEELAGEDGPAWEAGEPEPGAGVSTPAQADAEEMTEAMTEAMTEEAILLEEADEGSPEIDALPDLDQFDSTNYVGPDISGFKNGSNNFSQTQVDGIMSTEDPAQLAKAVRTFLKKDQEG